MTTESRAAEHGGFVSIVRAGLERKWGEIIETVSEWRDCLHSGHLLYYFLNGMECRLVFFCITRHFHCVCMFVASLVALCARMERWERACAGVWLLEVRRLRQNSSSF